MSNPWVENKVVVNIFGEDYPITGVTDPSHISRVADYVDSKMKEIARSSRINSRDGVAILAAMSIASELFEETGRLQHVEGQIDSKTDSILARLDESLSR